MPPFRMRINEVTWAAFAALHALCRALSPARHVRGFLSCPSFAPHPLRRLESGAGGRDAAHAIGPDLALVRDRGRGGGGADLDPAGRVVLVVRPDRGAGQRGTRP